jgi:hypothetical protein
VIKEGVTDMKTKITVILTIAIALAAACGAGAEDRVQLAILLDTSNSMDGLIEQAKSQLWKVVNELARARHNGKTPSLEVGLFQYGNNDIPETAGYISMVSGLTTDLDKISQELFTLTTNGGDEYCGMVIGKAVDSLAWSAAKDVLKVIYIAGNEPFTQGSVSFKTTCARAIAKGIAVNTIFCGSYQEGADTFWKAGAELADGRYMSIDQNQVVEEVTTPYDAEIVRLGGELNATYVAFGSVGVESKERQAEQDTNAAAMGAPVMVQRSVAKAQSVYANSTWDLVDAVQNKTVEVSKLKDEELPQEMRKMSPAEREKYVKDLAAKRAEIQKKINALNEQRRVFVAEYQKKNVAQNTLDQAILTSVKEQAEKKGYVIP